MTAEPIGPIAGRVVNKLAMDTGRIRQFPDGSEGMNQLAKVESAGALTPMALLSQAIEKGAGLEIISQFMDLQERYEKNEARKAFDQAMSLAKAGIPVITKNRHVGFDSKKAGAARTDYKHEDLAEIARTVDPILAKHGLSYRFRTSSAPNEPVTVTCIVSHELGHSEENTLQGPRDESGNKNSIQSIGSTITYLQRYSLKAALGLSAAADDDGRASEPVDAITLDQAADLRTDLEAIAQQDGKEVAPTIANFLKFMKVENLSDIPAARLEEAKTVLKQKLKANAK